MNCQMILGNHGNFNTLLFTVFITYSWGVAHQGESEQNEKYIALAFQCHYMCPIGGSGKGLKIINSWLCLQKIPFENRFWINYLLKSLTTSGNMVFYNTTLDLKERKDLMSLRIIVADLHVVLVTLSEMYPPAMSNKLFVLTVKNASGLEWQISFHFSLIASAYPLLCCCCLSVQLWKTISRFLVSK